jgi:hypothetical protein
MQFPRIPVLPVVVAFALLMRVSIAPAETVYSPTRVAGELGVCPGNGS